MVTVLFSFASVGSAVSTPASLMVAMALSLLVHVTPGSVPFGVMPAVKASVVSLNISVAAAWMVTLSTGVAASVSSSPLITW
ncbi:hypothetical protein Barb6_02416 [Bacteroidales bacterium Barb6]|nr:hypothetical protein Barb6_02416 [Bacteroidales bacterium Barb6]